jgi:hypothetical protein
MARRKKTRAQKGDGNIFKPKGCKFYYIRYRDSVPHKTRTGRLTRQRTESTHSTDIEVAKQLLRERLSAKRDGKSVPNPGHLMFKDLEELVLLDYERKENRSTNRLKTALNHLRRSREGDRHRLSVVGPVREQTQVGGSQQLLDQHRAVRLTASVQAGEADEEDHAAPRPR